MKRTVLGIVVVMTVAGAVLFGLRHYRLQQVEGRFTVAFRDGWGGIGSRPVTDLYCRRVAPEQFAGKPLYVEFGAAW